MPARFVVLISGSGSNLTALVDACEAGRLDASVVAVAADRDCPGLAVAEEHRIPTCVVAPRDHSSRAGWSEELGRRVAEHAPDLVVSAGFMRILSPVFVDAFAGRLINLHPSLLPAFPGAHAVRDALAAGVEATGTTVHLVDYDVDHGPILLQEPVAVLPGDTEATLHERIKQVEHRVLVEACRLLLPDPEPLYRMRPVKVKRALVSVSDKTGVVELARSLIALGVEVISSGGTAAELSAAALPVTRVSDVTGAPEILDGRVKTLHPAIHGGILADRRRSEHMVELARRGIEAIDLVVCNLYPFERTIEHPDVTDDDAVEQIDIGGPAMVRAAAKNFHSVAVVVGPDRYPLVLKEIESSGAVSLETRRELAAEAFSHTAAYDATIARYLEADDELPQRVDVTGHKLLDLRYGENPHQRAALYGRDDAAGVAAAEQLHGRDLSYNNLMDADAAWKLACDLPAPAAAIIKHSNPCGVALAGSLDEAYRKALDCDRTSAFGGVVALNDRCTVATAEQIAAIFTEVVIAPDLEDAALEILAARKNLRVLRASPVDPDAYELRTISGGMLVQAPDGADEVEDARIVTEREPSAEQWDDLRFAWIVAKHVKSNAIVLASDRTAVGIGAGQMSRVESTELAARRAGSRAPGTVCASDAFFPFRDGLDAVVAAGAVAVIQPGGSVRDDEVIRAANEHGIAMVFTGRRHFCH
ncbi:MAG: bifunctional phosphoribosylaminoimidazolecarboxamide formyltransferase/IMP cyclohydrolase [Actinomycetota bacterium]